MGLKFPRVTKCCYCIPLRLSTLLIGYISIVFACIAMIGCSLYIYKVTKYMNTHKYRPNSGHTVQEWNNMAIAVYLSFAYYILVFLYNISIHIVLLIGVHLNRHRYLKIYYTAACVLCAMTIPIVIITYIYMGFVVAVPMLKWSFTIFVCITVVRSYYLEIMEENKPQTYEMKTVIVSPQQQPLIT